MTGTKKALLITYYWPPSGGSGVQRWLYFAKYLPEFGIEPTVITVDPEKGSYAVFDESLIEEVKHIRAFRTDTRELIKWYSLLKSGNKQKQIPQGSVGGKKPGLLDRVAAYVRGNFFIPDARIGWNTFAIQKAAELLKSESFDLIITTGPPHSTHLIGLELKKRFGVKWLADFRDPWSEVFYNEVFNRTARSDRKDREFEQKVLESADQILTVGPSMQSLLQKKLPGKEEKVQFVFSGFDPEKLKRATTEKQEAFTITYVGTMGTAYPYQTVQNALKILGSTENCKPTEFILAGKIDPHVFASLKTVENENIRVHHKGQLDHEQALSLMKSADVLLLCLPFNELSTIFVSGKLLEYIGSGTPIAAIIDSQSDAAVLIREQQAGQIFGQNEESKLSTYLANLMLNPPTKSERFIEKYQRTETSKQVAEIIQEHF